MDYSYPVPDTSRFLLAENSVLDLERAVVKTGRREISLTPTECNLLVCLVESPRIPVPRNDLLHRVWENGCQPHTLNTHMQRLRRKLGRAARRIRTVRGVGYRWDPPEA